MLVISKLLCAFLPFFSYCTENVVGKDISKFINCGPNTINTISLSPCEVEPCVFHKGYNVTVSIDFNTDSPLVSAVKTKVYGQVAGIFVPYSLPNTDGCVSCNLTCPLTSGAHTYVNVFPVLAIYPDIKLVVKWELVDQDGNLLVCFEFPMSIVG
ncbi:NPC intracellular cholesterol transporter 2-like [Mya arenaria]|uniref:NPC intracellular cholesterol transporter 2-like n=1 Tax=Mya arenaria TaxID=6604 RepID=UPI0022E5C6BB|nr:NPC intracellular cholesterol transporter 2-like [Mya arenaria]